MARTKQTAKRSTGGGNIRATLAQRAQLHNDASLDKGPRVQIRKANFRRIRRNEQAVRGPFAVPFGFHTLKPLSKEEKITKFREKFPEGHQQLVQFASQYKGASSFGSSNNLPVFIHDEALNSRWADDYGEGCLPCDKPWPVHHISRFIKIPNARGIEVVSWSLLGHLLILIFI